ncbi:MAG: hypothetical protein Q9220_006139 [cf. Caloplaca sp. 1 TL-2023]
MSNLRTAHVREITHVFVNTAILLPSGENTEDHKKAQKEEAEIVEKDKATQTQRRGGLFDGRFRHLARSLAPIRDAHDGVDRCPMCTWELEAGLCNSCGYHSRGGAASFDDEDDDDYHSDAQSLSSLTLEEILADHPQDLDYDSAPSEDNAGRRRRFRDHIRRQAGLPIHRFHPELPVDLPSSMSEHESSSDEDLSEISQSTGSLRDFVDDVVIDDDGGEGNSDHSLNSPRPSSYFSGSDGITRNTVSPGSFSRDDSLRPHRRAGQRLRGRHSRRARISSTDSSDSESTVSTRTSRETSRQEDDNHGRADFSPLRPHSNEADSPHIIQVDSDSDTPPVRRTRKRPAALLISSDEEDNSSRGVNIPHSHASRGSSSSTARTDGNASGESTPRRSRQAAGISPMEEPSPVVIGSNSSRPYPSHALSSQRASRQRRTIPPLDSADVSSDDDFIVNGAPSRGDIDDHPASPEVDDTGEPQLRARLARRRQQPEQQVFRSTSPRQFPFTSPQHSATQRQRERKRLKRERRARKQQERLASRARGHPLNQPQQLAYIGM